MLLGTQVLLPLQLSPLGGNILCLLFRLHDIEPVTSLGCAVKAKYQYRH